MAQRTDVEVSPNPPATQEPNDSDCAATVRDAFGRASALWIRAKSVSQKPRDAMADYWRRARAVDWRLLRMALFREL